MVNSVFDLCGYLCRWCRLSEACVIWQVLVLNVGKGMVESIQTGKKNMISCCRNGNDQSLTGRAQAVPAKHKHRMATFIIVLEDSIQNVSKKETNRSGWLFPEGQDASTYPL